MEKMRFYYMDGNKREYLTLGKGSAKWANLDCPAIRIEGDETRWPGWLLLSDGLVFEDGNSDLYGATRNFVKKSGEAFYRKFPEVFKGRNGFLENFDFYYSKYHGKKEAVSC